MGYRIINGKPYLVGNFTNDNSPSKKTGNEPLIESRSFKAVLEKAVKQNSGYTISNHASERLKNANFTSADYIKIQSGFDIAREKGAKNSLILYKDVALITSIENKTIITAVEKERAKENVFTNIDSVVIL